ncbi:MAG TPA: hypothetical protein DDX68_07685 [Clostridium sp.]|nr:hypothetical protein [Clostridium sp.]
MDGTPDAFLCFFKKQNCSSDIVTINLGKETIANTGKSQRFKIRPFRLLCIWLYSQVITLDYA